MQGLVLSMLLSAATAVQWDLNQGLISVDLAQVAYCGY